MRGTRSNCEEPGGDVRRPPLRAVERLLDEDRAVPEPELEHFFKLVLAFDQIVDALPPSARALKIEVARRLIERYYEGHPQERKLEALRALEQLEED